MRPYVELAGLDGFFAEESYVLDIEAHPSMVVFKLDAVLTPTHPGYRSPSPGEQYCYRRAELRFLDVRRLAWSGQGAPAATDASGELDFGQIDRFEWDDVEMQLEGSWGRMDLVACRVALVIDA